MAVEDSVGETETLRASVLNVATAITDCTVDDKEDPQTPLLEV